MNAQQLMANYRIYAAAEAAANAAFDLRNFPNLPERPERTPAIVAGELIAQRGLAGARTVAEWGIEDPETPEPIKEAYSLILMAQ